MAWKALAGANSLVDSTGHYISFAHSCRSSYFYEVAVTHMLVPARALPASMHEEHRSQASSKAALCLTTDIMCKGALLTNTTLLLVRTP